MENEEIFAEWLADQMKARNWKRPELARRAGLHTSVIHKTLHQLNKRPSPDTCVALANAFGYKPEIVFRHAKLLPYDSGETEPSVTEARLASIFKQLTLEAQKELLEIAEVKLRFDK